MEDPPVRVHVERVDGELVRGHVERLEDLGEREVLACEREGVEVGAVGRSARAEV